MRVVAYHGTDQMDFTRFEIGQAGAYNIGLHFGTRCAAESRLAYLRKSGSSADCRLLACELMLQSAFRIDDIFGHTYAGVMEALREEIARTQSANGPLVQEFERLSDCMMSADDDEDFAADASRLTAFHREMNAAIRSLFQALGYDGFVYTNELEDGAAAEDSYCVFNASQIKIIGEDTNRLQFVLNC